MAKPARATTNVAAHVIYKAWCAWMSAVDPTQTFNLLQAAARVVQEVTLELLDRAERAKQVATQE
jgi:hypothetical protein